MFAAAGILLSAGAAWARTDTQRDSAQSLVASLSSGREPALCKAAVSALQFRGDEAIPALITAIRSSDHQQKHYAAAILSERVLTKANPQLISRIEFVSLIDASVEALRNDNIPNRALRRRDAYDDPDIFNARNAVEFLAANAAEAEPRLLTALDSQDLQQRLLAACALAFGGRSAHSADICRVLLPHLRDNRIREDSHWAVSALVFLGPTVLPYIRSALEHPVDEQQHQSLRSVQQQISWAEATGRRAWERGWDCPSHPLNLLTMEWGNSMTWRNATTPADKNQSIFAKPWSMWDDDEPVDERSMPPERLEAIRQAERELREAQLDAETIERRKR